MNEYNLTAGIHTLSLRTADAVCETPEITHLSKNPETGITTIRMNPNKLNGFVTSYGDFISVLDAILDKAGVHS